jgi:urease accessory protein
MKRLSAAPLALAGLAIELSTGSAAQAHGLAAGGASAGLTHPLLGLDHLFMLMAVGTAASYISAQLLLWALGGAVVGAAIGFTGLSLPSAELLASLSIAAVAALTLLIGRSANPGNSKLLTRIAEWAVAAGVALHALLHGLEAPKDDTTLLWWMGALLSSTAVCGGTFLVLRKLPTRWSQAAAVAFVVIGCWLAVGPLGLLAGGAAA